MSELAKLDAGIYTIRLVAGDSWRSITGVTGWITIPPMTKLVRVDDPTITAWSIKPQGETGLFQLSLKDSSLKDSYQYSGVDRGNVIATTEKSEDQIWRIKFWPDSEAFTIKLNTEGLPASTWTLTHMMHEVVIGKYKLQPDKFQLFKIEPISHN